jgi:hypothetical protein
MHTNPSLFGIACRAAAFGFFMAGTVSLMQAQQSTPVDSTLKAPLFLASGSAPADSAAASYSSSSSSSSFSDALASDSDSNARLDLSSAALDSSQPPPRRRYGRPNYSSGNTNPDGSDKWFGLGGFGLTLPIGDTHFYETPSYGLQVGAGRNFNKYAGVGLQFDYDHFGLQGATLANEQYIDNYCTVAQYDAGDCTPEGPAPAGTAVQVGGNNHVWSFTLNPTYTLAREGSAGAYLVVGAGYYHKVTNFTTPETEEYCYYYCSEIEANATFDHYTSNAFGVSPGFGLTWKFSRFSSERFYMEARYVLMLDSQRHGVTTANVANAPLNASDFYPANSNRTTYIPVKFGIRF